MGGTRLHFRLAVRELTEHFQSLGTLLGTPADRELSPS